MKGILFKPESVKAIVEGKKTQTRRVIKPQPLNDVRMISGCGVWSWEFNGDFIGESKPRYQVGETVYIKEPFIFKKGADIRESYIGTPDEGCLGFPPHYLYKLDDTEEVRDYGRVYKWRSPMMMPQHAARYFITITDVRAERLQEIPLIDVKKEGISEPSWSKYNSGIDAFAELWNSINKDYQWEMNPWVWVYSFVLSQQGGKA